MSQTSEAGPSRRTRRAQTERLQSLKGKSSHNSATGSVSASGSGSVSASGAASASGLGSGSAHAYHSSISTTTVEPSLSPAKKAKGGRNKDEGSTPFWSILAETKSKGKAKVNGDISASVSAGAGMGREGHGSLAPGNVKGKGKARAIDPDGMMPSSSLRSGSRSVSRARSMKNFREGPAGPGTGLVELNGTGGVNGEVVLSPAPPASPPNKRRKLKSRSYADLRGVAKGADQFEDLSVSSWASPGMGISGLAASSVNSRNPNSIMHPIPMPTSISSQSATSPSHTTTNTSNANSFRRVKLIVRPPVPTYTSPLQKPPPPTFSHSLTALLTSYTILDGEEANEEKIEERTREEVAFWDQVDRLRRRGGLKFLVDERGRVDLGGYESVSMSVNGSRAVSRSGASTPVPASVVSLERGRGDAWACVVDTIIAKRRRLPGGGPSVSAFTSPSGGGVDVGSGGGSSFFVDGRAVAAQVAGKVRAYWEAKAAREDKFRMQEERRLRTLAKTTIKMVVAEWKKAVYVSLSSSPPVLLGMYIWKVLLMIFMFSAWSCGTCMAHDIHSIYENKNDSASKKKSASGDTRTSMRSSANRGKSSKHSIWSLAGPMRRHA